MGTISPATDLTLLPILKPMLKLPFKYILLFAALSAVVAQSSDFTDDLSNDIESSGREAWGRFKKAPAPAPKEPRIFAPVCKCPACPKGHEVTQEVLLLQNGCSCKACARSAPEPRIFKPVCKCPACPKGQEVTQEVLLLQNGCSCKACPPIARAPCVCKKCPKCDEYEEDSEEEEAEVQAIPCRCPSLKCIPCKAPPIKIAPPRQLLRG